MKFLRPDSRSSAAWAAVYSAFGKHAALSGAPGAGLRRRASAREGGNDLNEGFRRRELETGVFLSRDPADFAEGFNDYAIDYDSGSGEFSTHKQSAGEKALKIAGGALSMATTAAGGFGLAKGKTAPANSNRLPLKYELATGSNGVTGVEPVVAEKDLIDAAAKSASGKSLLPGEGAVGTCDDLIAVGSKGDNITPHHIPSANHMAQHGVSKGDGIAINMEQPFPGSGGRHRATFTYGTQARPKSHSTSSPWTRHLGRS